MGWDVPYIQYCTVQSTLHFLRWGRGGGRGGSLWVSFEGSHAWKQRDMGYEDAWKPANLTTGRGWGPVEHSNPCRRTFAAIHYRGVQYRTYPPRKHPQPMMQMCRKHRWNRNLHETSKPWMRFVHHTYAHTRLCLLYPAVDYHFPRQKATWSARTQYATTAYSRIQQGVEQAQASSPHPLPRQPVGLPHFII